MKIKSAPGFTRYNSALGFTLVEILIVIAVLGVLAASVVVAINPMEHIARAKDSERKTNVANLFKALQASLVLNNGIYPPAEPTENSWMDDLVGAGELKNIPGSGNLLPSSCSAIGTEETAEFQDGYCYKVNASRSKAVVYTGLESNKELEGCTGTCDTAYNVLSSENLQPQVLFGSADLQPSTEGTIGEIYHTYDEGLVGHWKMDDNIGGNTSDSSSYGNNGSIIGADILATTNRHDAPETAFDFGPTGTSERIFISNPTSVHNLFVGGGTIAIWMKVDGTGTGLPGRVFAANTTSAGNNAAFNTWVNQSGSNYRLAFRSHWDSGYIDWRTVNFPIPQGVWTHLVFIFDYNSPTTKPIVYINGTTVDVENSADTHSGSILTQAGDFIIGNLHGASPSRKFDGDIDDVRLYKRVLTGPEIADLVDS